VNFGASDILLVSSIAPTGFLSAYDAHPHDVTYHLLYGSADTYMTGCPLGDGNQPFIIFERAEAYRHATYVHGAGHSDWLDDAAPDYAGPDPIGPEEAHRIAKAVYLALIKHYAEGNIPAKDFLWRQWEHFKPIGVSPDTTVVNEYRAGPDGVNFVIDDHESQPNPDTSSSGGSVTFDVSNLTEDRIDDADTVLTWMPSDPMNGMTRDGVNDTGRGVVFDWAEGGSYFYEYEIITAERDFSDDTYLSFRACQGTRHPETIAELADLNFTVTLRDTGGTTSSINFGVYGGGIEEPYQRDGCGEGVGWQNEFETIRIRLTDFLTNGSGLDLTDIEAVRFEFGQGFGSAQGRLGVDNVELTTD
jgi:uncharacterized protein YndB with AHSA1/START domain